MKEIDITEGYLSSFIENLRPDDLEIRKEIDFDYSWDGKVAYLNEIRPQWNKPENSLHRPFAKIRYYKSREEWKLYWLRASGKWESYEPFPTADTLQVLLDVIEKDEWHCFFG